MKCLSSSNLVHCIQRDRERDKERERDLWVGGGGMAHGGSTHTVHTSTSFPPKKVDLGVDSEISKVIANSSIGLHNHISV